MVKLNFLCMPCSYLITFFAIIYVTGCKISSKLSFPHFVSSGNFINIPCDVVYSSFTGKFSFLFLSVTFYRVLTFVFSEPLKRLSLCIYWVSLIFASVLRFYNISKNSKIERILLRKYYHLLAVLMFVPALIFQVICYLRRIIFHSGRIPW